MWGKNYFSKKDPVGQLDHLNFKDHSSSIFRGPMMQYRVLSNESRTVTRGMLDQKKLLLTQYKRMIKEPWVYHPPQHYNTVDGSGYLAQNSNWTIFRFMLVSIKHRKFRLNPPDWKKQISPELSWKVGGKNVTYIYCIF